jgi:hypothetical protein
MVEEAVEFFIRPTVCLKQGIRLTENPTIFWIPMTLNTSIKPLATLMPLLLLCACGGPQPKGATLSPPPSTKAAAMPKPKPLWPQSSQLKALPNYGQTSRIFTKVQNASAGEKFFRAYQAQQPGQWEQKAITIEGDPFFMRFYYLGQGTAVYVEYDTRQDQWSGTDFLKQRCDRLIPQKNNQSIFRQEGCHEIDAVKKRVYEPSSSGKHSMLKFNQSWLFSNETMARFVV